MANYTSVASGDFNNPKTWFSISDWAASTSYSLGNYVTPTSRNGYRYECTVAGTSGSSEPTWPTTPGNTVNDGTVTWTCRNGYPDTAADTFTVSSGHTVTLTHQQDVNLGASTINGILSFSPSNNTRLRFGNADLTVGATGKLYVGSSGSPIQSDKTAELYWDATSDNSKGLTMTNGAEVYVYGSDVIGSVLESRLQADWNGSATTIYVLDDVSSAWKDGQELFVHKGTTYSNYQSDFARVTINGTPTWDGSKTAIPITVNYASGTSWKAGGIVMNLTRNVYLGHYNWTSIRNPNQIGGSAPISNKPRISLTAGKLYWSWAGFMSFYGMSGTSFTDIVFEYSVIRGCVYPLNLYYGSFSHCLFVGNYAHTNSARMALFDNCYFCITGYGPLSTNTVLCQFIGCKFFAGTNSYGMSNLFYNCDIFSSSGIIGNMYFINGRIGYLGTSVMANSTDFATGSYIRCINTKMAATPTTEFYNTAGKAGLVLSGNHTQVDGVNYGVATFGIIETVTAGSGSPVPNQRSGGGSVLLEATSATNCGALANSYCPILIPDNSTAIWLSSGSNTLKFYVQTDTALTSSEIVADLYYYSSGQLTKVSGTGSGTGGNFLNARSDINDWSQYITFSFTMSQAGYALIDMKLSKASVNLWIDPVYDGFSGEVKWSLCQPVYYPATGGGGGGGGSVIGCGVIVPRAA